MESAVDGVQSLLFPAFLAVGAIWLVVSAYVVSSRILYELRERDVRRAEEALRDLDLELVSPEERVRRLEGILRHLPRKTVDRVAADALVPPHAAEAFATYALARWGSERLVRDATAHRGTAQKWRRIAALRVLFHGGHTRILGLLERALHERDRDVVGAAVDLLGSMDVRPAARQLLEVLRAQVYPPSRVATLLDGFALPIPDLLQPLLEDASPVVRFWGATLLARYAGTEGLEDRLVPLARDSEPLVRKAAIETLGRIGGAHAAAAALERLEDPVWYVRAHAARALGDLGRSDLADRIMPLLADREWWVRFAVKESLQAMDAGILPDLIPYLDHPDAFARNGAAEVVQNLGFLDALATGVANGADHAGRPALLRKITSAGGAGLTQALVGRARSADPASVPRLVESLSPGP